MWPVWNTSKVPIVNRGLLQSDCLSGYAANLLPLETLDSTTLASSVLALPGRSLAPSSSLCQAVSTEFSPKRVHDCFTIAIMAGYDSLFNETFQILGRKGYFETDLFTENTAGVKQPGGGVPLSHQQCTPTQFHFVRDFADVQFRFQATQALLARLSSNLRHISS